MKEYIEINIKIERPKECGKYIVKTKTMLSDNNYIQSRYNSGTEKFDCNNQTVTHWLKLKTPKEVLT